MPSVNFEIEWIYRNDLGEFEVITERFQHRDNFYRRVLQLRANPAASEIVAYRIDRVRLEI